MTYRYFRWDQYFTYDTHIRNIALTSNINTYNYKLNKSKNNDVMN